MTSPRSIPVRWFKARAATQGTEVATPHPWALIEARHVTLTRLRIGVLATHAPARVAAMGSDMQESEHYLRETTLHDQDDQRYLEHDGNQPRHTYVDLQNLWTFRQDADVTTALHPTKPILHVADPALLRDRLRQRLMAVDSRRGEIVGIRLRDSSTGADRINDRDTITAALGRAAKRAKLQWSRGLLTLPAVTLASDGGLHDRHPDVVWPLITVVGLVRSDQLLRAGAPTVQSDTSRAYCALTTMLMTVDYRDRDVYAQMQLDRVLDRDVPDFRQKTRATTEELGGLVRAILDNLG